MTLRVRSSCEAEDGWGGDGDGDAMGDDGVRDVVARVLVLTVLARDGVGHACVVLAEDLCEKGASGHTVAEMHASVAETNTGKCGGEEHLALRLVIIWVPDRAGKVFNSRPEGLEGEDITNRICALVSGAVNRVLRARNTLIIRDCCPALETVTEDVKTRGGVDGGGHSACV